jgi:hypothetical protein
MNISFINGFLGAFGVCPPCIDEDNAPNYLCDPCDSTVYSGGIAGWFAKKCNYEFDDITDSTEWETAIADKNVFGRVNGSRISGGLPAPEFTTKKRGWGLGLSLVKRIVEEYHKGKIFVRNSEAGKGTTFRIMLNAI